VEDTGDFEIDEDHLVGEGGMGILYQARQRSLGRLVVVKVLRDLLTARPEIVKLFRQEAELLAQVNHPNVVQVFGTGIWRKRLFYAMELVEGKDLATVLKEKKRFAPEDVLHVAEGVARALAAAWHFKIVHRDIKPSNILLTTEGVIKVADFGLAKSLRIPRTDSRLIGGTSEYISPEQGMGRRVDIRSDLYSLGAVLYELLSGGPPFKGDGSFTATVYQHVHSPPPALCLPEGSVPEGLEAIIVKCLRKKPDQRFQHPNELLEAIRQVRAQSGRGARVGPPSVAPSGGMRGSRWLRAAAAALGLALALALALGGGGYLLSRSFSTRTLFANVSTPEADRSVDLEVALFLEDFGRAQSLAESRRGRKSLEFNRVSAREADSRRHRLELTARENFRRHEWRAAAENLRLALEGVSGGDDREGRAALQVATDLLRAEEEVNAGRPAEAQQIYQDCLNRMPGERAYLEEMIESLNP
jgi:predicted Ser/Thr protein kinase